MKFYFFFPKKYLIFVAHFRKNNSFFQKDLIYKEELREQAP